MTETRRRLWVFAIDLPPDSVNAFATADGSDEDHTAWPLRDALGVRHLDADFIEVFDAATLADYGFARYLTEAQGMDAGSVAPDAAQLDALRGWVAILDAQALSNDETPAPQPPLHLIGTYVETRALTLPEPLVAQSAEGTLNGPPAKRPSDAAIMGRVAMVALLVIFALTALMVWVAS